MTARELDKLKYLPGLIAFYTSRIEELEDKLQPSGTSMDGMPHGTTRKNPLEELVPVIADLQEQVRKYKAEQKALEEFINSVEDYHIRSILFHRFVDGLEWNEVATRVGGGNTEDGVRKACYRFLEKSKQTQLPKNK